MSTDSGDHLILHYTDPSMPGGVETAIGDFARIVSQSGGRALVLAGSGSWKPHPGIAVVHEPLLDADGASAREALSALAQGARGLPTIARLTDVVRRRLTTLLPTGASWHLHNVATNTLNLPLTCALSELVGAGA